MYDFMKSEADAREVEFVISDGTKTGFFLSLRHESCKEVRMVEQRFRAKYMAAARKKNNNTNVLNDELIAERRLAHIADWRFADDSKMHIAGERPEFSKDSAKALLDADGILPHELRSFIDEIVGDASDFLESVESN